MAQSKILLDSNSYFRLARSIHPLLFQEFGEQRYCLYVLEELEQECARNPRLQNKFSWVNDPEYRENRQKRLALSRQQKKELTTVYEFLWNHVQTQLPGPSRIDVTILSHGYILGIPVATDDADMLALAKVFGVKVMKTLELLKLMLDKNHIDIATVRSVAAYWSYEDDRPKDYHKDYQRLFGEEPPP